MSKDSFLRNAYALLAKSLKAGKINSKKKYNRKKSKKEIKNEPIS